MEIPITFTFNGKTYAGHFDRVNGSGSNVKFHLTIGRMYYGQLFYTERYFWQFYGNVEGMETLADYFGQYVTAWLDGR
jgi:hypothetical protein